MQENPNYYAIIPAEVRYDPTLKDKAKLLYGEIVSLSNKSGYCFASNKYFADLYGVSQTTISLLIKNLVERGYIESEIIYKEGTKEILNRYLRIVKEGYLRNLKEGYLRKVKDNNTSINNTSINNKENIKRKFQKPTIEEIESYCKERNNRINAQKFFDFYETNGWVQGKNKPIKDWKACVRTWEQKEKKETPKWFDQEIKREDDFYISEEDKRRFGIT